MIEEVNVVFDTNAYRNLTLGCDEVGVKQLLDQVNKKEEERGITSILSVITLFELLAHLSSPNDPSYHHCKVATIGAYHHVYDSNNSARVLLYPKLLLQKLLLGEINVDEQEDIAILLRVAHSIHNNSSDKTISSLNQQLTVVRDSMKNCELGFVYDVKEEVIKIDPSSNGWKLFDENKYEKARFLSYLRNGGFENTIATAFVDETLASHTTDEPSVLQRREEMVNHVKDYFGVPIMLYKEMIERIVISGYDMTNPKKKRWNTLWDIYLLFSVSQNKLAGKSNLFVTEEKWLHEVCQKKNMKNSIITLKDYMKDLDILKD